MCEITGGKWTHRARLQDMIHAEEHQEDQTSEKDVHEHPGKDAMVFITIVKSAI